METYKDPRRAPQTRAADLLPRLSLDEKIAQLRAMWIDLSPDGNHQARRDQVLAGIGPDALRDALRFGLGQLSRPMGGRPIVAREGVRALNHFQKLMVEETRHGIPVIAHEECLTGLLTRGATLFPSALGYGASWNPELMEAIGDAIGAEARSVGARQVLAPVLEVSRDVRWGRTEECLGEDPYLVGLLATRYVKGIQGEKRDLIATLKHYVGHSFAEGGRNHAPVNIGWRELNDMFLLPFEMALKLGGAASVMPAYHANDGEPCHASHHLLTEVLRDEWGFAGTVVADYDGVGKLRRNHHVADDDAEASALAINAGVDIELPFGDCALQITAALRRGLLTLDTLDAAVLRVLTEKFRIGLFENPYADEERVVLQSADTVALARKAAQESIVVLDNNGILPLRGTPRIALIGPAADDPLAILSGYSFPVHMLMDDEIDDASDVVTPRAALEARYGTANVRFARGCNILDERFYGAPVFPGDGAVDMSNLDIASTLSTRLDMIGDAVAAAMASDVAIVCVGDLAGHSQTGTVGEGSDTDSLALPGVQQQLLDAVIATGKPVVVVVSSGRPLTLGGAEDRVAAQVMSFFGGQQAGPALVDVLSGDVEPSGRLPVSVPRSGGAAPYYYNHKFGSSGSPVARHFGSRYPFGHGLTFTRFRFDALTLASDRIDCQTGELDMSFNVTNTGDRHGIAVPQLYIRDLKASISRPLKELKAFHKLALAPGETRRVSFGVPTDMLGFTGVDGVRRVEPGRFSAMIGESSADIVLSTDFELVGNMHRPPQYWRMVSNFTAT